MQFVCKDIAYCRYRQETGIKKKENESHSSHKDECDQCQPYAAQYTDEHVSHSRLGHAAHDAERACDGGEHCDENFEDFTPVDILCHNDGVLVCVMKKKDNER